MKMDVAIYKILSKENLKIIKEALENEFFAIDCGLVPQDQELLKKRAERKEKLAELVSTISDELKRIGD